MSTPQGAVRPGRVLFIAHALNLSGVSRHMMILAKALQPHGWSFGAAARQLMPGTPMGLEWFESAGIPSFEVPFPLYGANLRNAVAAGRSVSRLRQAAQKFRADLLHVHASTLAPYAAVVGWMLGIPAISTLHGDTLGPNKIRLARIASTISPVMLGDYNVAISTDMARVLRETLGLPQERVRIIFHGADESRFVPPSAEERIEARRTYGLHESDRVVCMVATLDSNKGHAVLIRAVARLRKRGCDVVVLCAGTGPDPFQEHLRHLAEAAGIADLFRLLGHQDSRQVMWASDACILASRHEGFPLAIVESMLCRVVPLRTPAAGASDQIVDGQTGFIIPFDDDQVMAERLETLFANPDLREKMAQAARDYASARFTVAAMARSTEQLYADAVASADGKKARSTRTQVMS